LKQKNFFFDLNFENAREYMDNIRQKMSFNQFYSQFMEIQEYPCDISEIDEGFDCIPSKKPQFDDQQF
jgi:hypothetical protein